MSNILELQRFAENKKNIEMSQNPLSIFAQSFGAGIGSGALEEMKRREDERRRQANVKQQLSQAQQMMQTMAQMPDNSASGKAVGTLNDDADKRRKGVISVSDYVPQQEMSVDENGMLNMKIGYRRATPQEQEAQFKTKKAQMDMEKEQAKSDLLNSYVRGQVQEGAILGEMATLGITPEEFQAATGARERMRNSSQGGVPTGTPIPSGFQVNEMKPDQFGNMNPSAVGRTPVPTVQDKLAGVNLEKAQMDLGMEKAAQQQAGTPMPVPEGYRMAGYEPDKFGNMRPKGIEPIPATDIKAQKEMQAADVAEKKQEEYIQSGAQDMLNTIAEVKKGINNFGAAGGLPSWAWDYDRKSWESNVDKLLSKRVIDLMTEMKQASKTGATGMGALSEKELAVLQNASTALKRSIGPEQAEKILNDMEQALNKVLTGKTQGVQPAVQGGMSQTSKGTQYRVISE
jgi:hypothetical protein